MAPRVLVRALAVLLVLAAACGRRVSSPPGTGDRQVLTHAGIARTYVVRVPPTVTASKEAVPLVIVLHGGGGNALNAESMTGFTAKAGDEGFIVVYPDGTSRAGPFRTWNAGHCCGYAMEDEVDDVGFIRALVAALAATLPVDPRRVYATGMSNGAMMSHRLGVEASDVVAAVAPVVGAVFGDEPRPRRPVSALMINGMLDESVPYGGGPSGGRFRQSWDGTPTKPAPDQARFWAAANGCDATQQLEDRGRYVRLWHRCPTGVGVELYAVKDNGHAWPGGRGGSRLADPPSDAINATDVIWAFFAAHPRRRDVP